MDQKWEYMFIRGIYRGNTLFPEYVNGEPIQDSNLRSRSLYDYANELGDQGWDLLTVDKENERFAFKRPRLASAPLSEATPTTLPRKVRRKR